MKTLEVRLRFAADDEIVVGTLSQLERDSVFQFAPSFLASPLPISPFRLPMSSSVQIYDRKGGMETFGVFEDSLPDGWGRKIIDRHFLRSHGMPPTLLERFACIGENGMGALTYHPAEASDTVGAPLDVAALAENAWDFDDDRIEEVLPELRRLAGSSGGARPKALIGLNEATGAVMPNAPVLPEGYTHWIVKFNTRRDGLLSGPMEYVFSETARAAGAQVSPCRLIETKAGRFFATRRFDRLPGGRRLHLHSAAGLLHADFRIAGDEYRTLFRLTDALTRDYAAKRELYRRACLNVLAHNRDDHLKNFAFLMDADGRWTLSPLFDFTRSDGPNGWHTLSVSGEGHHPTTRDLLRLADDVDLAPADARDTIDAVQEAVAEIPSRMNGLGLAEKVHSQAISSPSPRRRP
jgi:serine/threonine-protein kinase HipA